MSLLFSTSLASSSLCSPHLTPLTETHLSLSSVLLAIDLAFFVRPALYPQSRPLDEGRALKAAGHIPRRTRFTSTTSTHQDTLYLPTHRSLSQTVIAIFQRTSLLKGGYTRCVVCCSYFVASADTNRIIPLPPILNTSLSGIEYSLFLRTIQQCSMYVVFRRTLPFYHANMDLIASHCAASNTTSFRHVSQFSMLLQ